MKGLIAVAVLGTTLAGCAAQPQRTITELSAMDPKFKSQECLDIRSKALTYDDKTGERMAIGVVSGLLLGPFGLPIAASADAAQNEQRKAFNREIALRCMSNPPPPEPPPAPTPQFEPG